MHKRRDGGVGVRRWGRAPGAVGRRCRRDRMPLLWRGTRKVEEPCASFWATRASLSRLCHGQTASCQPASSLSSPTRGSPISGTTTGHTCATTVATRRPGTPCTRGHRLQGRGVASGAGPARHRTGSERVYDRDLPALAQALAGVVDALDPAALMATPTALTTFSEPDQTGRPEPN